MKIIDYIAKNVRYKKWGLNSLSHIDMAIAYNRYKEDWRKFYTRKIVEDIHTDSCNYDGCRYDDPSCTVMLYKRLPKTPLYKSSIFVQIPKRGDIYVIAIISKKEECLDDHVKTIIEDKLHYNNDEYYIIPEPSVFYIITTIEVHKGHYLL